MTKITKYDLERLEEIKEEMKELVYEAQGLLPRGTIEYERAKSYWIPQILMALDEDHEYLGGSMCSLQETIEELSEEAEDEEDDVEEV